MPANVWAACIQIGMLQITNLESAALIEKGKDGCVNCLRTPLLLSGEKAGLEPCARLDELHRCAFSAPVVEAAYLWHWKPSSAT